MPRKIKVAEVVSRLESGGVKSMLLNYLGHCKHPEHLITPGFLRKFVGAFWSSGA
jgi:hypothetical protein